MPITKSAKKALRQSRRRTVFNQRVKKKAKELIRAFRKSPSRKKLAEVYSALDKAAKRNVFHKNKSARLKRRLTKLLKEKEEQKKTSKASSKKKAPKRKKTSAKMSKKEK